MIKKFTSLLICLTLLTGSAYSYVSAEAVYDEPIAVPVMEADSVKPELVTAAGSEPSVNALQDAIMAVKQKIQIPKEYSEFNYYYYGSGSYSDVYWSLNWRNPTDYSYIDVSLDKDLNFTGYSAYNYSENRTGVPSYLKNELQDEAEAFIKLIAPDIYSKLDFVSADYDGVYNNSYTYNFQRKENGIIFPDNTVIVRVNAATGEIRSAYIDWLRGVKIPSSNVKLSKDDAAKIIGENLNMKLSYKTNYYRIFDSGNSEYVKKAFLVYEPEISYISIDANTGEVYLTKSEWIETDTARNEELKKEIADDSSSVADAGSVVLTEEEIAKIRELENLISKDKAIEAVTSNKYLYIEDSLITYTAVLNQSYSTKDNERSYVWNITLSDNRPIDYNKNEDRYRAYANATVDAKTGKILSFNASIKNNYNPTTGEWLPVEIKYTRDEGQEILEKFLKSQVRNRFDKTKLAEKRDDYVAYYKEDNIPVYGGYSYRYNRFNEEVEFPYNGINGSVDGVTGKIYNFYTNWDDDIIFESPKGAMAPDEAFDHYISKDGFDLLYEINVINQYDPNYKSKERYYDYSEAYKVAYEIRLVYCPDIYPSYISPFSGEQLDYQGEVFKTSEPYQYSDIRDTDENREILLLADMNIGFEGGYFLPGNHITEGEINQLLEKLGYWISDSETVNASTKLITREELAYNFIKRLGLEKISKIPGIYTTGYADEGQINRDYLGAVALAKGLKLFPEQNSSFFNPKNNITRREAVSMLFNFVRAESERYY